MNLTTYWKSLISLVYPRTCVVCNRPLVDGEELICLHCNMDLPKTNYHLVEPNPLEIFLSGILDIKTAYSFLKYEKKGMAQKLIHELKYKGNREVGAFVGRLFAREIKHHVETQSLNFIVPVPLHRSRLIQRGFNQTYEIALGMSEVLGIPIQNGLIKRVSMKGSQAKRSKIERLTQKESEYVIVNETELEGKNILLLDDVVTTGATVLKVGRLLMESGASGICIACLATGK